MAEFVYNRTIDHVQRLKKLQEKGYENLTDSEKAEYHGAAALGAYNVSDLNRVESAVAELAPKFGLTLTTKTDWSYSSVPTRSSMSRYLSNVVKLRNAALTIDETLVFPTLPSDIIYLTWEGANNIEKTLSIVNDLITEGD